MRKFQFQNCKITKFLHKALFQNVIEFIAKLAYYMPPTVQSVNDRAQLFEVLIAKRHF